MCVCVWACVNAGEVGKDGSFLSYDLDEMLSFLCPVSDSLLGPWDNDEREKRFCTSLAKLANHKFPKFPYHVFQCSLRTLSWFQDPHSLSPNLLQIQTLFLLGIALKSRLKIKAFEISRRVPDCDTNRGLGAIRARCGSWSSIITKPCSTPHSFLP